jgi:exonuclease SbcC
VIAKASAERAAAQAEMRAADAAKSVAGRAQVEALARADRARARLADGDQVRAADAQLQDLRDTVVERAAAAQSRANELEAVRGKRLAGADDRIVALREGLEAIAEMPDSEDIRQANTLADSKLAVDDEAVKLATELPAELRAAEAALRTAQDALAVAQRKLADTERLAARLGDLDAAQADLDEAEQAAQAAEARWEEIHGNLSAAIKRVEAANRVIAAADTSALVDERDRLTPIAAKAQPLAQAEARLEQLEPLLSATRAEIARLESKLAATPAPAEPPPAPDVAAFRKLVETCERAAREAHGAVAVARQKVADAFEVQERLAGLEAQRAEIEADLADWTRLALDLGRSGLQSAEVDSAGPELTELCNDLLHSCHGPRFTVSVDTQRLDSTGHKTLDECRIQVIDSERGTEKEIREHSGGERVILGEAVSLALTMLACRRAGFDRPTLIRDESAAALDPENARAWVAMLRRAIEITGADKLVFVSHSPEVVELADAQIMIGAAA